ncbi:MAG: branched-chain amino acid ABC transporter permease [Betaproteobacteria bacterium]|nr:branched-chain amino acid ABC transporter permease [Betaproteobacteria bacterium]MDH5221496.1 branched-chain amino acid ABC transporter permease [Betaproteobacteria bacterium]MDH5352369.1 branched-chain amino acid ABC transporter permease [Betaproteobacteria bacterium]
MLDFLQAVSDGVLFGATYALIGIGFTLVFGVMHKINMAYAAASVGGAYAGLLVLQVMAGAPPWLVFLGAFLAGGVLGWMVYALCFHFIPLSNPLATLMSTVGMLLLIDEVIVHVTAGMPQNYPAMFDDVMLRAGEFSMRGDLLLVFAVSVLAMIGLLALLYRTSLGLATRAVSQQPVAAQLCGIRLVRVNALTFVVTGLLGGLAGAMIGASVGTLSPLLTTPLTVKGLIVTVIGGLGSIPGAILAGLLVGGFENVLQLYRGVTERDLYVMLLLFAFLTFRPGGLFAAKSGRD